VVALVAAAPVVWLALDWLGSGDALKSGEIATTSPLGSAAKSSTPALTVIERAGDAVIVPVLIFALVGLGSAAALMRRRPDHRDKAVVWLSGLAAGWIAIVAVMAEMGFTGRRRYLAVAAALMCVIAAAGLASLLSQVRPVRAQQGLAAAAAALFLVFAFSPARTDYRYVGLAEDQDAQLDELHDAVDRAGGAGRVGALGGAVVNPYVHTALAWKLGERLDGVEPTWSSTPRKPNWSPPAVIFRAPARLAGPRPAIPEGTSTRPLARSGRWRVAVVP
jgi:hypothetical protein